MKNATRCAKNLTALLKKLPPADPPDLPDQDDPVAVLIQSVLMTDATTEKAATAYRRLVTNIVDFNDLRVSMPNETSVYLGSRYPQAIDRCQRLRTMLRHVYLREHQVGLDRLETAGKREVRKYVESIEGISPYVAARTMLVAFDVHAMPVDEQLRDRLAEAGASDADTPVDELTVWLTRQIKAGEGLDAHRRLQAWAEQRKPARKKSTKKKKTVSRGKKTTRGATKKSATTKKRRTGSRAAG